MNWSMVQDVINPKVFKKVVKYFFEYNKFPHYAFDVPNLEYDSLYVTLTSFVQAPLTLVSLKKIYQLLDYESTNDDKLIISKYKKISSLDELFSFSFDLMRKNYFAKHTISIFKIIFNKWLINNNYLPLVFYPGVTNKIYELVKDSNDDQAKVIIDILYQRSLGLNSRNNITTSEYIKEIVLSNKEVVYNLYKINHVYLYGSYSKGLETKYSDIDLLIQADDLPGDTLKQILAFYNAIFEIPVDVHSIEKEEKFVGFSPELIY